MNINLYEAIEELAPEAFASFKGGNSQGDQRQCRLLFGICIQMH